MILQDRCDAFHFPQNRFVQFLIRVEAFVKTGMKFYFNSKPFFEACLFKAAIIFSAPFPLQLGH
ncbi:MAG: hypothetical protein A3F72_09210 [Bacteroidetes bacterium RIFCSPLOWO2_12_FULL_35_15]|nr:MAG: hypothetical protein A3F72_09210 [Bacteroidetes bacterium RIFCSPLOWO2_12_FULL_35_15]